jgi:PEGA domain-containing protein
VPAYSRPRDGRTQTGTAVEREYGVGGSGGQYPLYGGYYGSSYYFRSPYRLYYAPVYGFGLGYFYDPLWYDPYAYGYGSGAYGYGGYGYGGGYGGGGGYYGGSGQSGYDKGPTGAVRLKVKPREAQVFVDGFFVGDVDNFDGTFQKLAIDAGGHKLEVRAEGYEPIQFEVLVTPGETVTYKGELKRK